jgi:hypothetical protein
MDMQHKLIKELDLIISKAPDADIEGEFFNFCETHDAVLYDAHYKFEGILPRILLIVQMIKFQKDFMLGTDVKETLGRILNYSKMMGREDVLHHFSSKERMAQMTKILENKSIDVLTAQLRRRNA